MDHKCYQCGKCCTHYSSVYCFCLSEDELKRWKNNRKIMRWVDKVGENIYDAWISPITHEDIERCPWLRKLPKQDKYKCRIHDVKPDQCAGWPGDKEDIEKVNGKCNQINFK